MKTTFEEHYRIYRTHHKTLGCRVSHMIGVPLILMAAPTIFFSPPLSLGLFAVGWAFQFAGHAVWEKNNPLFLEDPFNPYTYLAAPLFCAQEWMRLLKGQALTDPTEAANS